MFCIKDFVINNVRLAALLWMYMQKSYCILIPWKYMHFQKVWESMTLPNFKDLSLWQESPNPQNLGTDTRDCLKQSLKKDACHLSEEWNESALPHSTDFLIFIRTLSYKVRNTFFWQFSWHNVPSHRWIRLIHDGLFTQQHNCNMTKGENYM